MFQSVTESRAALDILTGAFIGSVIVRVVANFALTLEA